MSVLRITTVQSELIWENPKANLRKFTTLLSPLADKTDLIILPEMFTTGFTMKPAPHAEAGDGNSVEWMRFMAKDLNTAITGSLIIEEGGKYFNRLFFMHPDGREETYDKKHLFSLAGEHENYAAGTEVKIIEYRGVKIRPLICYDLRFPVWSRNVQDYDLLLYVANWPETRSLHWNTLLAARAVENQCYTVGVNRVGEDANGFKYAGDTQVVDYGAKVIYRASGQENVTTTVLDFAAQKKYRSKLNFLRDRDEFEIKKG